MRTIESVRNTICSLFSYVCVLIIGFISQRVFKDVLGIRYLGLHNLFSNIMTMLAVAEMGFGSAIVVNLYKPVAEKNIQAIRLIISLCEITNRLKAA